MAELSTAFPVAPGETRTTITNGSETLMELARREGFGYEIVANSNRSVDPWILKTGAKITLPGQVVLQHGSIVVLNINLVRKFEGLQPVDFATLTDTGTLLRGCLGGIEGDYGKTT